MSRFAFLLPLLGILFLSCRYELYLTLTPSPCIGPQCTNLILDTVMTRSWLFRDCLTVRIPSSMILIIPERVNHSSTKRSRQVFASYFTLVESHGQFVD